MRPQIFSGYIISARHSQAGADGGSISGSGGRSGTRRRAPKSQTVAWPHLGNDRYGEQLSAAPRSLPNTQLRRPERQRSGPAAPVPAQPGGAASPAPPTWASRGGSEQSDRAGGSPGAAPAPDAAMSPAVPPSGRAAGA
ncbi:double C2-like domain-containing protein beta [Motacilla alba alba]|uniref:double C2-like domain-containing protein beta n=1 Tax=Motacilla alba alba TaxID=1094192 RepID=UPI0018D51CEF|nr:double C2-like domain-containing protein beta [Motacilla alba alba]